MRWCGAYFVVFRFRRSVRTQGPGFAVVSGDSAGSGRVSGLASADAARIASIRGPMMFMTRLRLSASTCKAIFRTNPFQRLRLEVGRSHPGLDGSEWMLDGFATLAHLLRMLVETSLDGLENVFELPSGVSGAPCPWCIPP